MGIITENPRIPEGMALNDCALNFMPCSKYLQNLLFRGVFLSLALLLIPTPGSPVKVNEDLEQRTRW